MALGDRAIKAFRRVSFSFPAIGISKCVFNNRAIYRKRLVVKCSTRSRKGDRTEGGPDVSALILQCKTFQCF